MNDLEVLIEQMALDVTKQAWQLDAPRLRLFLNWLMDHNSGMKAALGGFDAGLQARLQPALKAWFVSLPGPGLLWEYRLLLEEIAWWRGLGPGHAEFRFMEKEGS